MSTLLRHAFRVPYLARGAGGPYHTLAWPKSATSGDALSHAKKDDRGHYLLLGKPVFISNSRDDIGATNKPVIFGDFNRLLIRHVPAEAAIRRYDELYMANMQKGFEMLFRADALIMHAS